LEKRRKLKSLKKKLNQRPPDKSLEARISLGKMVKASLDEKRTKCASEILRVLRKKSENLLIHDAMDDSMIMNVAFLITKDDKEIFESKVDQLDERYQDSVDFRIVGPLPPYSFCTFEVRKRIFGNKRGKKGPGIR